MTESATPTLPPEIVHAIGLLGRGEWRERKAAAAALSEALAMRWADCPPEAIIDSLLDAVTDPEDVMGRAGAREVLIGLDAAALAVLRRRLDGTPPMMNHLVDLLGDLPSKVDRERDLVWLRALVDSDEADENLRAAAISSLAAIGGEGAVEVLLSLLDGSSQMIRSYLLDALREAGGQVPVDRVGSLLGSKVTRKAAVDLLAESASVDAIPLLIPVLGDRMPSVRSATVLALVSLHAALAEGEHKAALPAALERASSSIRERVRELISHRDEQVAAAAVDLASLARDADSVSALLPAMASPRVETRALEFVARLGARANPPLLALVEAATAEEYGRLFRMLGAMSPDAIDSRLLSPVVSTLEGPNEALAIAACDTLARVGGRQAMASLYRRCAAAGSLGERASDALASIAERLGNTGHDDLMLIVGGVWPQDGPLARNLCRVVGRLGLVNFVPPLVSMLGASDVRVRVSAALALGQIEGDHEGVGALSFALADEDAQVRAAASRSLGSLDAARSVQPLLSATSDPSALVRAAAVQALVAIENNIALPRFRDLIHDDPSPNVVVHAIAGLGVSGSDRDLSLLMSLCTSADHEVVKAAARALSGFGAHRATAALLGLLAHERWDVRWAAAEVLARRGDPTALSPLRGALSVEADGLVREVLVRAINALGASGGSGGGDEEPSRKR
jgi:HEAT repeat protein